MASSSSAASRATYDGVQLSCEAGQRKLYLTPEGALRLAFLLAAAVERDIDIR
jgi:hypothetical protein